LDLLGLLAQGQILAVQSLPRLDQPVLLGLPLEVS